MRIDAGAGDDLVSVGQLAKNAMTGARIIDGGAGLDTITFNTAADQGLFLSINENGSLASYSYFAADAVADPDVDPDQEVGNMDTPGADLTLRNFEVYQGSDQANFVDASSFHGKAGLDLELRGGSGDDQFYLGELKEGSVIIASGDGDDCINLQAGSQGYTSIHDSAGEDTIKFHGLAPTVGANSLWFALDTSDSENLTLKIAGVDGRSPTVSGSNRFGILAYTVGKADGMGADRLELYSVSSPDDPLASIDLAYVVKQLQDSDKVNGFYQLKLAPQQDINVPDNAIPGGTIGKNQATTVQGGQTVVNTIVQPDGVQTITTGGNAIGTQVYDGGQQVVAAGGTATGTYIRKGHLITVGQMVEAGGTAIDCVIGESGEQYVWGYAKNTSVNAKDSHQSVIYGGQADNTLLKNGGKQSVGGIAFGTLVQKDGHQLVLDGGLASNTIVEAGGDLKLQPGGEAESVEIKNGGLLAIGDLPILSGTVRNQATALDVKAFGGSKIEVKKYGKLDSLVASSGSLIVMENGSTFAGENKISGATITGTGTAKFDAGTSMEFCGNVLVKDLVLQTHAFGATIAISGDGNRIHDLRTATWDNINFDLRGIDVLSTSSMLTLGSMHNLNGAKNIVVCSGQASGVYELATNLSQDTYFNLYNNETAQDAKLGNLSLLALPVVHMNGVSYGLQLANGGDQLNLVVGREGSDIQATGELTLGSKGSNYITGSGASEIFYGQGGGDVIMAGGGNDVVIFGEEDWGTSYVVQHSCIAESPDNWNVTILLNGLDTKDITTRTIDLDFGKLTYISKNGTDQSIIVSTHADTAPTIKYVGGMEAFGDFVDAKTPTPDQRAEAIRSVAENAGIAFQPTSQAAALSLLDGEIEYFGLADGLADLQTLSAGAENSPVTLDFATVAGSGQINNQLLAGSLDLDSLTGQPGRKDDDLSLLSGTENKMI